MAAGDEQVAFAGGADGDRVEQAVLGDGEGELIDFGGVAVDAGVMWALEVDQVGKDR